ncbi:hypothetical protein K701_04020 [Streptomyces fradiae ATCC 10745 = DSM 40063]|uniref:Uncharacterized protein n=1 Tax=Streptomyces fradiae ATCC 10745 = DSM 40063 TaxID=1319510 RepID=A0ABQ6Y028_STRFR|nr:hypothetical protein K701_04020 [Streptomyces fradiae ATCC 10745 = DSM 40063]
MTTVMTTAESAARRTVCGEGVQRRAIEARGVNTDLS